MSLYYLAGPMRGKPLYAFPAFDRAAAFIRAQGHMVFNPAEADRARGLHPETFPPGYNWNNVPEGFDW